MTAPLQRLAGTRIAQIIESDGPGGAERVVSGLAAALAGGGCTVVAFLPEGGEGWLAREVAEAGVPVERVPVGGPLSPEGISALAAGFRRHRITLAHSHDFTMAVAGAVAARRAGIPHVVTMHGGRYYAQRLRRRMALRLSTVLSAGVAAVSGPLAGALRRDLWPLGGRVRVIPNGIGCRTSPPAPLRRDLQLAAGDRLVVAVGNLYPVKGHATLVAALAHLPDHVHVAIAGRGAAADALKRQAAGLNVHDRLHLLGLRDDIPGVLAAADVFAMPSLSEGLPMALLEAMCAGVPVVATAVGDVPAVLEQGAAGVLVPPGDAAALARELGRLLRHRGEAAVLGRRGARRVRAAYSRDAMVDAYATLYRSALTGRLAPARNRAPAPIAAGRPPSRRSVSGA